MFQIALEPLPLARKEGGRSGVARLFKSRTPIGIRDKVDRLHQPAVVRWHVVKSVDKRLEVARAIASSSVPLVGAKALAVLVFLSNVIADGHDRRCESSVDLFD